MDDEIADLIGSPRKNTAPVAAPEHSPYVRGGVSHERVKTLARAEASKVGRAGAFIYGVEDTITFGFLDELSARANSSLPTWAGGNGKSYEENLQLNREFLKEIDAKHGGSFIAGQLVGGLVPIIGWGGRAYKASQVAGKAATTASARHAASAGMIGNMAMIGAVEGGLYGAGSAEGSEDGSWGSELKSRLTGATFGAAVGAGGGMLLGATVVPLMQSGTRRVAAIFQQGKTPKLDIIFKKDGLPDKAGPLPSPAVRASAAQTPAANAPKAPQTFLNDLTGKSADELTPGALVTSKELLGNAEAARQSIYDRLAKLTPEQATKLARELADAEGSGNLADSVHYQSLLGIDMKAAGVDEDEIIRAIVNLEEASSGIVAKAGELSRTVKQADGDMARKYGAALTEQDVDASLLRAREAVSDTRVGQHALMIASLQFIRAKDRLLVNVMGGNKEARTELTDELVTALRLAAKGRAIMGWAGRALGDMSHKGRLISAEIKDDVIEITDAKSIRARVDAALNELSDTDLTALVSRMRTLDDLPKIEAILTNKEEAAAFKQWEAVKSTLGPFANTIGASIKSGLMSVTATPAWNALGAVAHDFFRNDLARTWAANGYSRLGMANEALAMRFERDAARAVYWQAHKVGMQNAFKRLQWETFESVERIAGVGYGPGTVREWALGKKRGMVAKGYRPPEIREQEVGGYANVQNPDAFNARNAERLANGGAFGTLAYHSRKVGAIATNTYHEAALGTIKIAIGAVDDWGRSFVKLKETYALSARHAVREAIELGIPPDDMGKWASRRAQELAEMPPAEILNKVEQQLMTKGELGDDLRFLLEREQSVETEAAKIMFLDGPQTGAGRAAEKAAGWLDNVLGGGLIRGTFMPYRATPIRIFEAGTTLYAPWGRKTKEMQDILAKGGPEAEIARAQMEVGGFVMGLGAMAAAAGAYKVTNGPWKSSENLRGAPPSHVEFPGGFSVEIGRLDPFALTLAFGGMIGQAANAYMEHGTTYEHEEAVQQAMQTAFLGFRDVFLEKSFMMSLKDLLRHATSDDPGQLGDAWLKMIQKGVGALVPFAGTNKQLTETYRGESVEAVGFIDNLLRSAPGGSMYLPARVDALGDVIPSRTLGMATGFDKSKTDDVRARLADLGINLNTIERRDPRKFKLTGEELNELRHIRGHEAQNAEGQTMREALAELLDDPWFQQLTTKKRKQEEVGKVIGEFNEPAREIYEQRNPQYRADRRANESFKDYMAEGYVDRSTARRLSSEDNIAEGLMAPSRLQ
ncbi:MAG TPA: hypothetical protein VNS79_02285 [Sphingobium sp.]|nr:hypothetical protein [Sphingobium sp.]